MIPAAASLLFGCAQTETAIITSDVNELQVGVDAGTSVDVTVAPTFSPSVVNATQLPDGRHGAMSAWMLVGWLPVGDSTTEGLQATVTSGERGLGSFQDGHGANQTLILNDACAENPDSWAVTLDDRGCTITFVIRLAASGPDDGTFHVSPWASAEFQTVATPGDASVDLAVVVSAPN